VQPYAHLVPSAEYYSLAPLYCFCSHNLYGIAQPLHSHYIYQTGVCLRYIHWSLTAQRGARVPGVDKGAMQ
jgi:hypothetical protein